MDGIQTNGKAQMELSSQILSDIVVHTKYARYRPEDKRREVWSELVERNKQMHKKRFPELSEMLDTAYQYVVDRKVLPSMRSMQFGGKPIELSPNRVYNCCYAPIDDVAVFSEIMFLLLGGTGVGYSVQKQHVAKLPEVRKPLQRNRRHLVGDSIEGWSDAINVLMRAYFEGRSNPVFDFSDVRAKGTLLKTSGGRAPGPQPLMDCIHNIRKLLDAKEPGTKLTPLEAHDIVCYMADAVLSGGIRRAALISLFSIDDEEMLGCKAGNWWELNPQRGRANNSAVVVRHKVAKADFFRLWDRIKSSGFGEPGVYFTNNADWGTNPSLRAGTKVLTTEGIFPIEDLQDKEFSVKNLTGQVSKAKCWLSGRGKRLYKITLVGGHEYYATPEHEWPVWTENKFVKVRSDALSAGNKLPVITESSLFAGTKGDYEDGFFIGWHLADGWTTVRKEGNIQNGLIVSKKDMEYGIADRLSAYLRTKLGLNCNFSDRDSTLELNTSANSWNQLMREYGYGNKSQGLPSAVWAGGSEEFRRGLLDALFSADGHVEKGKKRITLTTAHEKLAKDVSELLGFYGVKSSITYSVASPFGDKEYGRYNLRITDGNSIRHFRTIFKLSVGYKNDQLKAYQFRRNTVSSNLIEIKSVELSDVVEDVWDISVFDETHCFQIAHCVTGNCCEIALRPYQFCNLVTMDVSTVTSQDDFNARCKASAQLATIQAAYTDFHYLRDVWKTNTEKDALLGCSMTGIASNRLEELGIDIAAGVRVITETNKGLANQLGISPAARCTCVKPEGTASLVLGTSSGIHAWHSPYYLRRLRINKEEPIYQYLMDTIPDLMEDEYFNPSREAVLTIPIKAPDGAVFRSESPLDMLERVKRYKDSWVTPGHISGDNSHNISATISIKDDEWGTVGNWMWENRDCYNGLSVLPYDGTEYKQMPFEECSKEVYECEVVKLRGIDLTQVLEGEDNTSVKQEVACGGGACEL